VALKVRLTVQAEGMSQLDHAGVDMPVAALVVDVREVLHGAEFGLYEIVGAAEALVKREGTPGRASEITTCWAVLFPVSFVTDMV
jgi:hypothetical protein